MNASLLTRIFDLIAPRQCVICGQRLAVTESVLCANCHRHLPLTLFEQHPHDNNMAQYLRGRFPVCRAAALFHYEAKSSAAQLIYELKYHHRPDIGEHLGRITARQFAAAGFFQGIDAIVPVPLAPRRQWRRGYNQSKEIARGISDFTGIPVYDNIVRRTNFHQSQTHLSQWQRQANIDSSFHLLHPERIHGRHLLLVDDIVTTGTTVANLAQTLQQAGGVRFSVIALGFTKSK